MKQRKEDVRSFALIAGSGLLGAVAALVGVSLMESSAEVQDPPAPVWKWQVTDVNPSRVRATISYSLHERPVEVHRMGASEVRFFSETRFGPFHERSREVAEARARLEEAVAEATAKHAESDRSSALDPEFQAELQASLEALEAQLESSFRNLEGTITGIQVRASDPDAAPVVYVDGVRFDGAMENLSPDDIESIDVIKGDAAIEQYGKEGENGVIIIKKRKKPGKKRKGGP